VLDRAGEVTHRESVSISVGACRAAPSDARKPQRKAGLVPSRELHRVERDLEDDARLDGAVMTVIGDGDIEQQRGHLGDLNIGEPVYALPMVARSSVSSTRTAKVTSLSTPRRLP